MAIILIEGFEDRPQYAAPSSSAGQVMDGEAGSGRDGAGVSIRGSNGGGDSIVTLAFTAGSDTIFAHCGYKPVTNQGSTTTGNTWCSFYSDSGTVQHLTLNINSIGQITLRRGGPSSTIIATSTQTLTANVWYSVEMKVTIHDTTGEFILRVGGVDWINFTGDTRNGGSSTVISHVNLYARGGNEWHDDWLINDTTGGANDSWPGEVVIVGLRANNNGASSALVGSDGNSVNNYLLVDELAPSASDYVGSVTDLAKDTYEFADIIKVGTVLAVRAGALVWKSDAGNKGLDFITRSSGGTEVLDHASVLSTSQQFLSGPIRLTDADGNPWTVARVNSAQFGVGVTDAV